MWSVLGRGKKAEREKVKHARGSVLLDRLARAASVNR